MDAGDTLTIPLSVPLISSRRFRWTNFDRLPGGTFSPYTSRKNPVFHSRHYRFRGCRKITRKRSCQRVEGMDKMVNTVSHRIVAVDESPEKVTSTLGGNGQDC